MCLKQVKFAGAVAVLLAWFTLPTSAMIRFIDSTGVETNISFLKDGIVLGHFNLTSISNAPGIFILPGGMFPTLNLFLPPPPLPPALRVYKDASIARESAVGERICTGMNLDLAIKGPGFFLVRDPGTSELFATRAGMFRLDRDDYVVTPDRKRLQGWVDAKKQTRGDIRIDNHIADNGNTNLIFHWFSISRTGAISIRCLDDQEYLRAFVEIHDFAFPGRLVRDPNGLWRNIENAGPRPVSIAKLGMDEGIYDGYLELVNVPKAWLEERAECPLLLQEAMVATGSSDNLAMLGEGFFLIRDPADGALLATRSILLHTTPDGYVECEWGGRVQAWAGPTGTETVDLKFTAPTTAMVGASEISSKLLPLRPMPLSQFQTGLISSATVSNVATGRFKEAFLLRAGKHGCLENTGPACLFRPPPGVLGEIKQGYKSTPAPNMVLAPPPQTGIRIGLDLPTFTDASRVIEWSDDLLHWHLLTALASSNHTLEITDPDASVGPQRFYRYYFKP